MIKKCDDKKKALGSDKKKLIPHIIDYSIRFHLHFRTRIYMVAYKDFTLRKRSANAHCQVALRNI